MFEDHYGLAGRPFQLTPDPAIWFDSATHRKAMAYLGYGLAQGEGFIVITGEVGAGKTTLINHLFSTLDRDRLHIVPLVSTQVAADDLLRMTALSLGIAGDAMDKARLLAEIERTLHATVQGGRRTLLVVDEAQALSTDAIEELRMLSNFTAHGHALIQIILLAQPEFRDKLHAPGLEQLRQRVLATHHLEPMEVEEVAGYLAHRLRHVGWTGRPSFTDAACRALHAASGGIPRVINQIATRVLLHGAVERLEVIDADVIALVVADRLADTAYAPARDAGTGAYAADAADAGVARRLADLEARIEEQDIALRRVLHLLLAQAQAGKARGDARADAPDSAAA